MKNNIYLILLLCTAMACSGPTSSNSDDQDPIEPPEQAGEIIEEITVGNEDNSRTLTFGFQKELTAGYDTDTEIESPPFNPPGSFFAHFVIPEHNLFKDLRSSKSKSADWHLALSSKGGNLLDLSWDINDNDFNGTLLLQDKLNDPNVAINMKAENSFTLDPREYGNDLYIVYNGGKSKSSVVPSAASTVSSGKSSAFSDFPINPANGNSNLNKSLDKEF